MTTAVNKIEPSRLKKLRLSATEVACHDCGLFGLCLVAGLGNPESARLNHIVRRHETVDTGDSLVRTGQPSRDIFAVKSGSFRSYAVMPDGREKTVGFHFPGELIGLEAIDRGRYIHHVDALENASVCRMDISKPSLLGRYRQRFQDELIRAMSRRLLHAQWMSVLLSTHSAEQRLAAFLASVSSRLSSHGLNSREFRLPMLRPDIANHLGLAVETVSRTFQQFQTRGILSVRGRHVQLHDLEGLKDLASVEPLWGVLSEVN